MFNRRTYDNDIALIKLNKPAILTDKVNIACIPPNTVSPKPVLAGRSITGYFKLEPSPLARFIMILTALTKIVTRPSVKSKSVASCSGYEIDK